MRRFIIIVLICGFVGVLAAAIVFAYHSRRPLPISLQLAGTTTLSGGQVQVTMRMINVGNETLIYKGARDPEYTVEIETMTGVERKTVSPAGPYRTGYNLVIFRPGETNAFGVILPGDSVRWKVSIPVRRSTWWERLHMYVHSHRLQKYVPRILWNDVSQGPDRHSYETYIVAFTNSLNAQP